MSANLPKFKGLFCSLQHSVSYLLSKQLSNSYFISTSNELLVDPDKHIEFLPDFIH